jgi:hypothetical protein
MPCICYTPKDFTRDHRNLITLANQIITDYKGQGFDLTLRQLYYQMVARDIIDNTEKSYKRLSSILNDARLAGLVDWLGIIDRTRGMRGVTHWRDPAEIVRSTAYNYAIDKWADQKNRVEVWVEKDALVGIVGSACSKWDVDFFSCRGYTSASEMWVAAQRLEQYVQAGQTPVILHFGDHDPSGRDMTRDIIARLQLFMGGVEVQRLALNMDQIEKYNPPPNPTKLTDSRSNTYVAEFGHNSWELDALEPHVLVSLIETNVRTFLDETKWANAVDREEKDRRILEATSSNWTPVSAFVNKKFLTTPEKPQRKRRKVSASQKRRQKAEAAKLKQKPKPKQKSKRGITGKGQVRSKGRVR